MNLKRLFLLLVAVLLVAGCAAPVAPATTGGEAAAPAAAGGEGGPNVLTVAATANLTTWDPIKSFSTEALYLANFYEPLLRVNPPDAAERFEPVLAESWESSADGLTWTFKLRPGVTFHDGEPLTADAVKMSIDAAKERAGASFIWAPLDSVEVVDDLTVQFNLSYAAPLDLIASSLYGAWIVSPKALEAAAADDTYFEQGIEAGTGPYMLESYTPDQEVLMTRFDEYWGGWQDGQFDKVLVMIVPEAVQQQQMLEGGEVDLALRIPEENYASFADKPGYTLVSEPSYFNYVGFLNTLRPPLDNQARAPGHRLRHSLPGHHRRGDLWPGDAGARPRAGRRVALLRKCDAVQPGSGQGQGAAGGSRLWPMASICA